MNALIAEIAKTLTDEVERFRNRDFLKATMAASALLAMTDGEVTLPEQLARDYLLDNVRELKLYDVHKAVDLFREYVEAIQADPDAATEKIFKMVSKFTKDRDHAIVLVRASILIAKSDRPLGESEKEVIAKICRVLSLNTSEAVCIDPAA